MFGVSVLGVLSKTEQRLVSEFNTMKKDGVVFAPWVSPRPPEAITKTISKSRQSKLRFIVTSHDSKEVIAHLRFPLRTDRSKTVVGYEPGTADTLIQLNGPRCIGASRGPTSSSLRRISGTHQFALKIAQRRAFSARF